MVRLHNYFYGNLCSLFMWEAEGDKNAVLEAEKERMADGAINGSIMKPDFWE